MYRSHLVQEGKRSALWPPEATNKRCQFPREDEDQRPGILATLRHRSTNTIHDATGNHRSRDTILSGSLIRDRHPKLLLQRPHLFITVDVGHPVLLRRYEPPTRIQCGVGQRLLPAFAYGTCCHQIPSALKMSHPPSRPRGCAMDGLRRGNYIDAILAKRSATSMVTQSRCLPSVRRGRRLCRA